MLFCWIPQNSPLVVYHRGAMVAEQKDTPFVSGTHRWYLLQQFFANTDVR
jgi:hypothetical protein